MGAHGERGEMCALIAAAVWNVCEGLVGMFIGVITFGWEAATQVRRSFPEWNGRCGRIHIMNNAHIARAFQTIADILTLQDENPFRIRAYERAALTIADLSEDMEMLYARQGRAGLQAMPGIGADLSAKIEEMITTGKMAFLSQLQKKVPAGLLEVLEIEGLGPKKVKFLWKEFSVQSVADVERLAKSGELGKQKGWGEKSVENVLAGITALRAHHERIAINVALSIAEDVVKLLQASGLCGKVEIAGSLRRRKDTVGDIDILVTSDHPAKVMDVFCGFYLVERVLAKGGTKASVHLSAGLDMDVRVVEEEVFGAALHYFTGSKEHNIALRKRALQKGKTISEYGVYEGTAEEKGKLLASQTEEEVYRSIDLPFIPPELREKRGEIEAAEAGVLPVLIEEKDLRGDVHVHSNFSDGSVTMTQMAQAAQQKGLQYIVFCDHASPMGMVQGIKDRNIHAYLATIEEARQAVPGITIFAGAEVDILEDGSLYLADETMSRLDWVTASVHAHFKLSVKEMTTRLLRALDNPNVRLLGHPTGRLLLRRDPIEFDTDAVFAKAAERKIALEINASVFRLDLNDVLIFKAKDRGAMLAINSDAHHPRDLDYRYGISQARRGWLSKEDVINAKTIQEFEKFLR